MKHIKIFLGLFFTVVCFSCTKLDEKFRGEVSQGNVGSITAAQLLISAYELLPGQFVGDGNLWTTNEITSDEAIAPTRAGDWDDNGLWRSLQSHSWNADHGYIRNSYEGLLKAQFAFSNVLQFSPSTQQAAEARFMRALTIYAVLDGYDQVPYREDLTNYKILPVTLKGTEAADFVISEVNAVINDLPDTGPAYVPGKNAARALLMKTKLNYGAYINRAAPSFPADKMNDVIALADQIITSNKYSLDDNFFDNFSPDNDVKSSENIFTFYNNAGDNRGANQMRATTFSIYHYNMNPGGWNGWTTLSDFYDKFEATDKRRGAVYAYPGSLPNPGNRVNIGFLIGQQYNLTTDAPLSDRTGAPLIFIREVKLRETGNNLEVTGIRPIKYGFDYNSSGDNKNNDWVIFRLADVLLMKAEAILRGGTGTAAGSYGSTALSIVNSVRAVRGVAALGSVDANALLDERGREMYWEGYRRQDQIRFGKFLQAWQEKAASDPRNLLFPIPNSQLAVNPNLTQNPGYSQ